tara:strand:+ start:630 stop:788 length:159 start_codon:yes stop_codon:yes gene_type:complete
MAFSKPSLKLGDVPKGSLEMTTNDQKIKTKSKAYKLGKEHKSIKPMVEPLTH